MKLKKRQQGGTVKLVSVISRNDDVTPSPRVVRDDEPTRRLPPEKLPDAPRTRYEIPAQQDSSAGVIWLIVIPIVVTALIAITMAAISAHPVAAGQVASGEWEVPSWAEQAHAAVRQ